ncbi:phospholipase A [Vibrio sp. DNB22_17_1]
MQFRYCSDGLVHSEVSFATCSFWHLFSFRESNYKPQVVLAHQTNMMLYNHLEIGYRHESNGQSSKLSRCWDRFYIAAERLRPLPEPNWTRYSFGEFIESFHWLVDFTSFFVSV